MSNIHITPTWHKAGYHLHEFNEEGEWVKATFFHTKVEAEEAKKDFEVEKSSNAVEILHKRYVGDDPERKASLQQERNNVQTLRS
jgi:hypothetical protein